MNNRGFTLVELLGAVVILTVLVGVSAYSIIGVLNSIKENNYKLLIDNIKKASETYYQECVYGNKCIFDENISLGDLVLNGYLSSNNEDDKSKVINPITNKDISNCIITIGYSNFSITITPQTVSDDCPSVGDYK